MSEQINLAEINRAIADRTNVFYWQTDRAVDPVQAGHIWADRHRYFTDDQVVDAVNNELQGDELVELEPFQAESQTNLGNVNSVRVGELKSSKEVIIRSHPRGVKNGYFHVESLAAEKAKEQGIPAYKTLAIHDFSGGDDFAFQVIEKLSGTALQKWLEQHPQDEAKLLKKAGETMAKLHTVKVEGFGPFDNEKAKKGDLVGLHTTFGEAVRAGLEFNLDVLKAEGIISDNTAKKITKLFGDDNPLLNIDSAVLVHNDFADWNLLTDGSDITGVLDLDECVAGDPVSDIACWSTFFSPDRLGGFLDGYWSKAEKPKDFEEKFELLRLRYMLSKMTLRVRRYGWDPSDFMKEKIENGKEHLKESFQYYGFGDTNGD